MKKTFNAFLSRGIDTIIANELIQKKYTVNKLKMMTEPELMKLGLDKKVAQGILDEKRPPIPVNTVVKLLYESKRTCCVCRDNTKGIIIHHIVDWSTSKDHSEDNLVVLCTEHHDLAHTQKELTLNLSKKQLVEFKKRWVQDVKFLDAKAILGLSTLNHSRWDYFNHKRIFELYLKKNISNEGFKATQRVRTLGLIDELGTFGIENDEEKSQHYSFKDGYMLGYYMDELFDETLKTIPLIDLTDKFSKQEIEALVRPGAYIALQAGFYFKDLSKEHRGKGQRRLCYYQKNHIRFEFEFDAYETTSNSAWGSHLRGHRTITPICFVKSMTQQAGLMMVGVSCLAIGSYFKESTSRKNITPIVSYYSMGPD